MIIMKTNLDHLVVAASSIEQGVDYIREVLDIDIPFGGVHEQMGTHNHLLRLGNDIFLEVISIHPDVPSPKSPRWFGLDDPKIRKQIAQKPQLLTWVVNTKTITALTRSAIISFGEPNMLTRGNLSWYFGLPDDGRLIAGGMAPYIIEWQADQHPAVNMPELGCRFQKLEIYHAYPQWLRSVLNSIDALDLIEIHALPKNETPYLLAHIKTPNGIKTLRSL